MKKSFFVLAIMMVLLVSSSVSANWVDGTYEGWSDASEKSINYAKVFIEDGEITAVILREYTNLLVEKDFAVYPWEQAKEAFQTMGLKFVEAQSHDVDIITGATGSSTGYIQAVERALMKADPNENLGKYFDGVFFGRSAYADRGYYEVAKVTIKDDKIESVTFERILDDFSVQDPDEYGWSLELAWQAYSDAAAESEPGYVDTISGATGITTMGNIAVREALDRASTK